MMRKKKTFKSIISLFLVTLLLFSCFPITASAKTKIADIEIEPITIIEGTFGDYDYNDDYFKYCPEDLLCYTVTFDNGNTYSSDGYSFEYDGEWYWFETETDQSINNQWVSGNTYTMTVSLSGVSVDVPVTITDTPIESIEVEPISIIEYTKGAWQKEFNYESGKYERSYYYYNISDYAFGTVYFADGTSTEFDCGLGGEFEYNGETYWVSVSDDQSVQNPWTAGNEYSIELEAMGITASVPVTIEKFPIESIELEPITVVEGIGGEWYTYDGEDCYIYDVANSLEYTLTFDNGEVVSGYGRWVEYDGDYYKIEIVDNQELDNPWVAGETYIVTAEFMGCTAQTEVYIDYSPVESIKIEPVFIYEHTIGFMDGFYDVEADEDVDEYFYYEPASVMDYEVVFKNGEIVTDVGAKVLYNDEAYTFDVLTAQSYDDQWTAGNTYEIDVFLAGVKTVVEVTILECPIESIELEYIEIPEGFYGYYEKEFNEETGEYDLEYLRYFPEECMKYKVIFKDGTVVSGVGSSVEYDGRVYEFEVITDQSYENQWTVGNTYTYTASLMNFEVEGELTIIKSPVKSIEFEPISIPAGTGGSYIWDYNPETDEWDSFYFYYIPEELMEYTINFNDGSVYEGVGEMFEYDRYLCWMETETDQAYNNHWTVGNTYTMTVTVMGEVYYVDVTITESLVESIEVKPVTVYEEIDGYYVAEEDFETGEMIEYFYYFPEDVVEYTVTFKDGTIVNGCGNGFEYDGNYYEIAVYTDQSSENMWEVGNTYTAEFLCMETITDIEVSVKEYVEGDVNCDGVANISDVTYIQKCLAGFDEFTVSQYFMADLNWDGDVTIADATYLQKMLAGLI